MVEVKILREGYSKEIDGKVKASGTITLIRSEKNVIVDTGNVGEENIIAEKLLKENLKPNDIHFVVNTHGHTDHIGNNNLFKNAFFVSFGSYSKGDEFGFFEDEFDIDKNIKIIKTPGHTPLDVSVIVNTETGTIVVAGDTFENEKDHDGKEAKAYSMDWNKHLESRQKILKIANYIIPGHGKMFKVK